ncbi:hypothetical protein [Nostoc sp. WHI]|uniref:hypothetical protein n=1 Tax=Nostoc sp. WHI TaxID=2650611 RepID=UPI0018C479F1|nr:hypothetical protein [Nostoc sp. WHI]MBG1270914.1 hypothetical protein [Nostoc sp. WHI]MBG1270915.1 hypothetical protein [Nostoc sp. WHI]
MMTITNISIEQQSLSQDSISQFTAISSQILLQVLNDVELELETILVTEFKQELSADIIPSF